MFIFFTTIYIILNPSKDFLKNTYLTIEFKLLFIIILLVIKDLFIVLNLKLIFTHFEIKNIENYLFNAMLIARLLNFLLIKYSLCLSKCLNFFTFSLLIYLRNN